MRARTRVRVAGIAACGLVLSLGSASPATAAGFFWADAPAAGDVGGRWRLSLEGESVADRVEQAPNAPGGGFEPERTKSRYAAGALALDWRPSDAWRLRASLGRRRVNFLRDAYAIGALHIGVARHLTSPSRAFGLELVLDLDANRAEELYKNSWTEVGGASLRGARLFDARDGTLMASLVARGELRSATRVAAMIGIGRTHATHEGLGGNAVDADGCAFDFEASGGAGELALVEPCGSLVTYSERYANEAGIEDRLGLAPSVDLEHEGNVLQAGAALSHPFGRVDLTLGYVYRRNDRDAIDDRLRERDAAFVTTSHTTSLTLGYDVGGGIGVAAGVNYRSTSYLDELPLLYNAFTSERFSGNALSFGGAFMFSF